jgi:putative hemolysin
MNTETLAPPRAERAPAHHLRAAVAPTIISGKFSVRWAASEQDVREAQRLRYLVFAEEMGAHLSPPAGTLPGLDADGFDPFCDHLMVSSVVDNCPGAGRLIGTYRVLSPQAARRAGGLYIDTEFDLAPLSGLRRHAVELGRSCVHPDWRSGAVIMALWTALLQYMLEHRLDTMIGCASVSLSDGGQSAAGLWSRLRHTHLVAPELRVQPRVEWKPSPQEPSDILRRGYCTASSAPPLIKGYLRCGALLLGPPALDAAFNTADLPIMLRMGDMAPRYRQHFLRH